MLRDRGRGERPIDKTLRRATRRGETSGFLLATGVCGADPCLLILRSLLVPGPGHRLWRRRRLRAAAESAIHWTSRLVH